MKWIRKPVWFAALLLAAACSSEDASDFDILSSRLAKSPTRNAETVTLLTNKILSGAPAYNATVLASGQSSGVVEIATRNGLGTWLAVDNATLTLRDGILVATRGLGYDMMAAEVGGTAKLLGAKSGGQAVRSYDFMDGENQISNIVVQCTVTTSGTGVFQFNGINEPTAVYRETCVGDAPISNEYAIGQKTSRLLSTTQWAGPGIGYVKLERLQ